MWKKHLTREQSQANYLLGNKFSQVSGEFCGLIDDSSQPCDLDIFFCSYRVKGCPNLLFQVAREVQDIQIQWTEMAQVPMWNNRIPNRFGKG